MVELMPVLLQAKFSQNFFHQEQLPQLTLRLMRTNNNIVFYTTTLVAIMGTLLLGVVYYEVSHSLRAQILKEQESRMRVAWDCLHQRGNPMSVQNGKLMVGSYSLNGDVDIVDRITGLVGGTATLFLYDKRIATNVRLPDGSRAVGTQWIKGEAHQAVLEEGQNFRGEVSILGEPYFTAYDPIRDSSGKVIGALQVGTKAAVYSRTLQQILIRTIVVTALCTLLIGTLVYIAFKRITREIEGIAEKKRLILESSGEGIFGLDAQGRCTFMNTAGATLLGYDREEVIGKDFHQLVHHTHPDGSDYPAQNCHLCFNILGEKIRRNDEVFWKKDGSFLPTRYVAAPIKENSFVCGCVVTFNDISERKRYEEELVKKTRELQEVLNSAGQVKHEKSPVLVSIEGVLDGTNRLLETSLTPEQRNVVGNIRNSSDFLLKIIEKAPQRIEK
jgi:PAS domain S-box-containing protein